MLPDNAKILRSLDDSAASWHTWGRWRECDATRAGARWFVPTYLVCGDYNDSGLVERSNLRVFKSQFADGEGVWWHDVTGGYGTDAVVIRTLAYRLMTDVREFFDGLSAYPLADEDDHSELELETQREDWNSYGRSDFVHAMHAAADDAYDAIEALTSEQVDALYYALCRETGIYPESEGSGGASLFNDDVIVAAWERDGFRVPRLTNGKAEYHTGDVSAWRALADTHLDESHVRCTEHEDCKACPELAHACRADAVRDALDAS